jgi:hypothetical protein
MLRKPSVAVLGAGHGGMASAAYLSHRGHDVCLWNRSPERVAAVADRHGIQLTSACGDTVQAPIAHATCHMAEAVSNASVVFITVPACAHADVARTCAPYLRQGQTVLLMPGRTGGALEFRCVLRKAGCRAQILLGEANTFPFAARSPEPARAVIYGAKAEVLAAALPARRTTELLAACRSFLPMLCPARSVLHTGLANLGAILHPVITLLNADRIQRGESFDFYREGVTSPVAATLAARRCCTQHRNVPRLLRQRRLQANRRRLSARRENGVGPRRTATAVLGGADRLEIAGPFRVCSLSPPLPCTQGRGVGGEGWFLAGISPPPPNTPTPADPRRGAFGTDS